jgi:hypothetical protein
VSNFYYNDLNNFFSLSGLVHDVGGVACAFAIGASAMRNKLPALMGAYFFAQVPELINTYNGHLTGPEIFWEGGKDIMLLGAAYGLNSILMAMGRMQGGRYRIEEEECITGEKKGRAWWRKK